MEQQKVKSVKHGTTITELVVVWRLCSVCTSVTSSKAVIHYYTSRFLLYYSYAKSRKVPVLILRLSMLKLYNIYFMYTQVRNT